MKITFFYLYLIASFEGSLSFTIPTPQWCQFDQEDLNFQVIQPKAQSFMPLAEVSFKKLSNDYFHSL